MDIPCSRGTAPEERKEQLAHLDRECQSRRASCKRYARVRHARGSRSDFRRLLLLRGCRRRCSILLRLAPLRGRLAAAALPLALALVQHLLGELVVR